MTQQEELALEVEGLLLQAKERHDQIPRAMVDHDLRKLIAWETLSELLLGPLTPDQVRLVSTLVRCIR